MSAADMDGFLDYFNLYGLIPRSLLRRDSGVGWVESFGVAQDRLHDTHRSPYDAESKM